MWLEFCAILLSVCVWPSTMQKNGPIRYHAVLGGEGYRFDYKTDDSERFESGTLSKGQIPVIVVRGTYSYDSPDGKNYVVIYEADEKGYRAKVRSGPVTENLSPTPQQPVKKKPFVGSAVLGTLAGGGLG